MCGTCGCSDEARPVLTDLQTGESTPLREHVEPNAAQHHAHIHPHDRLYDADHHARASADEAHISDAPAAVMPHARHAHFVDSAPSVVAPVGATLRLEQEVLAKNNALSQRNRDWFAARNILALNLVSSPGAGKTTLLERTIRELHDEFPICVVEGDQATLADARRIQVAGAPVVQINTGTACHLDADMLARGLERLTPPPSSLVLIENVGNLVCPALFDLGERAKVVIVSVTEGEDKPLKYPHMFRAGDVLLLNKTDLLPYVAFDQDQCLAYAREVNPRLEVFHISATRGDGLEEWFAWLRARMPQPQPQPLASGTVG